MCSTSLQITVPQHGVAHVWGIPISSCDGEDGWYAACEVFGVFVCVCVCVRGGGGRGDLRSFTPCPVSTNTRIILHQLPWSPGLINHCSLSKYLAEVLITSKVNICLDPSGWLHVKHASTCYHHTNLLTDKGATIQTRRHPFLKRMRKGSSVGEVGKHLP